MCHTQRRGNTEAPSVTVKHTFELGVSNAAPLSSAISNACTPHHVTKDIVAFVPLIADAVHDTFTCCTDFLMSWDTQTQH